MTPAEPLTVADFVRSVESMDRAAANAQRGYERDMAWAQEIVRLRPGETRGDAVERIKRAWAAFKRGERPAL